MVLLFAGSLNLAASIYEIKTNATLILGDRCSSCAVRVLLPGRWSRTNPRGPPSLMLARGGTEPIQSQPPVASGSPGEEIASSVDHMPWWWRFFMVINTYYSVMPTFPPENTCQVCHYESHTTSHYSVNYGPCFTFLFLFKAGIF